MSSPQINGTIRDNEKPASPSVDRASKSKILEGKKRGVKRKRASCSSSENSPLVFSKSDDSESHPGTPNSGQDTGLGSQRSSNTSMVLTPQTSEEKECSSSVSQTPQGEQKDLLSVSQASQLQSTLSADKGHLPSASWTLDSQSSEDHSVPSVDSGIGSQPGFKNLEELNSETQTLANESELNCRRSEATDIDPCISQDSYNNVADTGWNSQSLTDVPSGSNTGSNIASNSSDADVKPFQETLVEQETPTSPTPKELILDVNVEANGVTGRYGGDGAWYDWTTVMPSSDGMLQVLPYVILE